MLPNGIFSLGLKPKEFAVYCCLVRHRDREKDCYFPSRRTLAKECCMDNLTEITKRYAELNATLTELLERKRWSDGNG